MKWKVGDELMVRVKIVSADPADRWPYGLRAGEDDSTYFVNQSALASATLIERPLAVGDSVLWGPIDMGYTISSIDGNLAVVRHGILAWLAPLSELRRAEERG